MCIFVTNRGTVNCFCINLTNYAHEIITDYTNNNKANRGFSSWDIKQVSNKKINQNWYMLLTLRLTRIDVRNPLFPISFSSPQIFLLLQIFFNMTAEQIKKLCNASLIDQPKNKPLSRTTLANV